MKSSKVSTPAYKLMKKIEKVVRERVQYFSSDYVVKSRQLTDCCGEIVVYSEEDCITHVCIETIVLIATYFMETLGFGCVNYGVCSYEGKGCIKISVMKSKNEK